MPACWRTAKTSTDEAASDWTGMSRKARELGKSDVDDESVLSEMLGRKGLRQRGEPTGLHDTGAGGAGRQSLRTGRVKGVATCGTATCTSPIVADSPPHRPPAREDVRVARACVDDDVQWRGRRSWKEDLVQVRRRAAVSCDGRGARVDAVEDGGVGQRRRRVAASELMGAAGVEGIGIPHERGRSQQKGEKKVGRRAPSSPAP